MLQYLLILDGERLSYRTLDVEQIGSVYETMMGFSLEVAQGRSIAIKAAKAHGAPTTINLETLLASKGADRAKWLKEKADQSLTGQAANALKDAKTVEDVVAALEKKAARDATPNIVPEGAMILQPSDERRRSGSHYTPRSLTEPIVRTTLRPIVERLGPNVTPEQILELKVCDPAMGSGAFLVEACRQLAEVLVTAWHGHNCVPVIPADEDEILHARRIVAQRFLYGVDKNPMAVDLAKLSLWLATLAKDHPFTFLDHALRCGDSLVGLSTDQIIGFNWKPDRQRDFVRNVIGKRIERATESRREIREAPENAPESLLSQKLALAEEALNPLRFYGDVVIAAFFAGDNDKKRKEKLDGLAETVAAYLTNPHHLTLREPLDAARRTLASGDKPIAPFHWEIEFPEVFGRENPGFDALVGNPPFLGGTRISSATGLNYKEFLYEAFAESGNRMDLVAYFFRRAFGLIRKDASFGLIATNTVAQGDTRKGGLSYICRNGASIFDARRRIRWPGAAAVVVSVVHLFRGRYPGECHLDDRTVPQITAFLFSEGGHNDPEKQSANRGVCFEGFKLAGQGFIFDDHDDEATPLAEMERLLLDPNNRRVIFPYIGGEELNDSPVQAHHRFAIDFGDLELQEAQAWIALLEIVQQKVKPYRDTVNRDAHRTRWWQYGEKRPGLRKALQGRSRVLVNSKTSAYIAFAFLPTNILYSHKLNLFMLSKFCEFAAIQSRPHESWALFFGSSMKDDPVYTPSDCFETYPFPIEIDANASLETAGRAYYEFRAASMIRNNEGLTKTYNRFHDPDERSPDIIKLRELHAAMDRAVLDAYGWTDLNPTCEYLLDYEEDEDENESAGPRRRKKPWRYRWPDDFRDKVLARLLELNRVRAEEERLSGAAVEAGRTKAKTKSATRKKTEATTLQDVQTKLPGM